MQFDIVGSSMSRSDRLPLLRQQSRSGSSGLSLFFASLCIFDIFGVFPIITLPRTIVQCGWLGIPSVLVVFAFQTYTAILIGKSWNIATTIDPHIYRKSRYPMAAVTEFTLGRRASMIVSILVDLSIFGGGIPNLLVASQNLQIFGLSVSEREFNISFCYWLLVVGVLLCPVMWLGSPRDMKWLVFFSTSTCVITALFIWWSILNDHSRINFQPIPTSPPWDLFISGYGVLAFQFDIHPTLMSIQVDMKQPKDINKAIVLAFLTIGALFMTTTGLVMWRYGGGATANMLQIVPPGWPIRAAILLAALQLCLSSAIGHSALFQHIEDQLKVQKSFSWKRCALRSAVMFLAVAVGESVPRFDIVMSLIGGTLTGPLVFILPPLMYSKIKARFRALTLRRSSAPEFLCSGPEQRRNTDDVFTDPRVHSKSTHYGFRNGDENKNDGYSFFYYDDDDDDESETNSYAGNETRLLCDYGSLTKRPEGISEISRSESLPMMMNKKKSSVLELRKVKKIKVHQRFKKLCTLDKLSDWFGYCIVIVGIIITISSTYINIKNTIEYVTFIPPCIINATVDIPSM